jgi:hypothetical protein
MSLFGSLIVLHVITGAVGLMAFWVPILSRKGARSHRRWGRIACYGFIGAGVLAIAMALLSLFGPEERLPSVTDRALFDGLFGWMMLYLGCLTVGFADYGLAVVRHARARSELRRVRYQAVIIVVVTAAMVCGLYGLWIANALMVAVSGLGIAAMGLQQRFIWRRTPPPAGAHIGEHFRALIGMGISAYTAFMSVGMIRWLPEQVFNPLVWAIPSTVGVAMIIGFTMRKTPQKAQANSSRVRA